MNKKIIFALYIVLLALYILFSVLRRKYWGWSFGIGAVAGIFDASYVQLFGENRFDKGGYKGGYKGFLISFIKTFLPFAFSIALIIFLSTLSQPAEIETTAPATTEPANEGMTNLDQNEEDKKIKLRKN